MIERSRSPNRTAPAWRVGKVRTLDALRTVDLPVELVGESAAWGVELRSDVDLHQTLPRCCSSPVRLACNEMEMKTEMRSREESP